jgi:hypothetical protein
VDRHHLLLPVRAAVLVGRQGVLQR